MICNYPYKQSFSGERPLTQRPSCFYIMNHVPERHIDLVCVICYKIMSTLSFKIMKEKKTLKCYVEYYTNSFVVIRNQLHFGIQLFFKKQQHSNIVMKKLAYNF